MILSREKQLPESRCSAGASLVRISDRVRSGYLAVTGGCLASRTLIDTNDELLERARAVLGTGTKKDTVNAALAQVVALNARRQFLDDARRGDLTDAAEEQLMDQAWRR